MLTKRNDLLSKLSYRTRKRMTALNMCSDSESDYSASTSEEGDDACSVSAVLPKIPIRSQTSSVPPNKETSAKKLKRYISILNSITEEVLNHMGTFRSPQDQVDFILKSFKEVWDQAKQSMYNWLWYETTTFSPYAEETAYENSLLVQHSGSLALSSLTHVLCSLTSNARGIFRLLVEYQLENKDNPSYLGLSFQDLYQRCREAFLVNSDLTLRAQLIEFRDHKLIRTKRGADGVEYLLIPVDAGILADFLQKDNDV
ncbi:origin recognition complex subunit 2 [Crotalus adamanteus]|uniref:Origin recognition complex subunit 2 n=1 Tax=Crotalus adamanteus TaxID=8729 RepID=A0AAW1C951_CROAD